MTRYIGIDPGPTPGIAVLEVDGGFLWEAEMLQCTSRLLVPVLSALAQDRKVIVVVERFVVRGRATKDQTVTRDQVAVLQQLYPRAVQRTASQVKPWATDRRLQDAVLVPEAGVDTSLFLRTAGMRHARDAARHALYAAVHDGALPDPLSRKATR